MGLLNRLAPRRPDADLPPGPPAAADDPVFATKALRKFLTSLTANASPALLDPVAPKPGDRVKLAVRREDDQLVLIRIEKLP